MVYSRWIEIALILGVVAFTRSQDLLRINYGVRFEHVTSTAHLLNGHVRHVFHLRLPDVMFNATPKPPSICRLLRPRVADESCDTIRKLAPSLIDINTEIVKR
jgi:hypothetical protein